jgi:hypothetical protein
MLRYSSITEPNYFARVKLILHYPFCEVDEVLTINSKMFNSYSNAYNYCRATCSYVLVDSYGLPYLGINKDNPTLKLPKNLNIDDFNKLARRWPSLSGLVIN